MYIDSNVKNIININNLNVPNVKRNSIEYLLKMKSNNHHATISNTNS